MTIFQVADYKLLMQFGIGQIVRNK
jgi:hypothetical protein